MSPAERIEHLRTAYSSTEKARCAERLRHHIWTPRSPHRRIHRLYRCCHCHRECQTEAHHVDYTRPFLVSWLCTSCHRKVEAGSIKLGKRHMFNYESLVNSEPHRWRSGDRGPQAQSIIGRRRQRVLEEVPF